MRTNSFTIASPFQFKYLSLLVFLCFAVTGNLNAQGTYQLSGSGNAIKIVGKSNVHDWTMTASNPVCDANFGALTSEGIPKSLNSLNFKVNATNLKSDSESMNKRAYKTMKADAHPQITFKLISASITPSTKNKFTIKASGTLTIAGVSKVINMLVNGEVKSDNTITCTGQQKLKLTEFGIQPPSFMLGAMKVGDDLAISFNFNFKK